ncbi:MAG: redox-regulated ATPase YchF [Planctomycetes bacterium]|nr:redox-regulated ATPase YchF [Planctomycetota bacterium]
MRIALVGGPSAGKTTILAAVTGHDYAASVVSQAAGKPRDGHAQVPDARVDRLAEKWKPKKTTRAMLDFNDTQPLFFSGPERDRNRETLATIREADGLAIVLDDYGAEARYGDAAAIAAAVEDYRAELIVADLDQVEKRIERLELSTKKQHPYRDVELKELAVHRRFKEALEGNHFVSTVKLSIEEAKLVKGFRFLSEKPLIVVLNVSEARLGKTPEVPALTAKGVPLVPLAARLELELLQMPADERAAFMADYGLTALATPGLVAAAHRALGLACFLTMGDDECRAWTIAQGDDAVTAAGKIHSDLSKGFIAAEVVAFADWDAVGGVMKDVKAQGKFRTEGRGYLVKDGDILNIKFNV